MHDSIQSHRGPFPWQAIAHRAQYLRWFILYHQARREASHAPEYRAPQVAHARDCRKGHQVRKA